MDGTEATRQYGEGEAIVWTCKKNLIDIEIVLFCGTSRSALHYIKV